MIAGDLGVTAKTLEESVVERLQGLYGHAWANSSRLFRIDLKWLVKHQMTSSPCHSCLDANMLYIRSVILPLAIGQAEHMLALTRRGPHRRTGPGPAPHRLTCRSSRHGARDTHVLNRFSGRDRRGLRRYTQISCEPAVRSRDAPDVTSTVQTPTPLRHQPKVLGKTY